MKIQLKNEMETLLIPLYGKAKMSKIGVFKDSFAEVAIDKLEYDYSKLKIQKKDTNYACNACINIRRFYKRLS